MGSQGVATMTIQCSFFARYAEIIGSDRIRVAVPAGASVATAVAVVRRSVPNGDKLPNRPMVAVNQEHALPDLELQDGDEMAFLPPLAGG
jgi:molybdopterin synthase catalytic subunit